MTTSRAPRGTGARARVTPLNYIRVIALGDTVKVRRYRDGEPLEGVVFSIDPRRAWADITIEGGEVARIHVYDVHVSHWRF